MLNNEKSLEHFAQLYDNKYIDYIHYFIKNNFPDDLILFTQILTKLILLLTLCYFSDIIFYKFLKPIIVKIVEKFKLTRGKLLVKYKIIDTLLHLIPMYMLYELFPYFFYHHPKSFNILNHLISVSLIIIFTQLAYRIINSFEELITREGQSYNNIAIRSFGQLIKIIIAILNCFLIFSILSGIQVRDILTILGTLTAVVLLIFRDSILGFVSGIQISSSKMVKVDDWISIPKYDLDGYVKEINLITTKILNLDKTISSIPTYDLISTEIRNSAPMHASKVRQIKRSIIFKISSFQFLDKTMYNELSSIDLLKEYLKKSKEDIDIHNKENIENLQKLINGRQLTNIGVFRKYVYNYLSERNDVTKNEFIVVRQLQIIPQGLPLEIVCFVNQTKWEYFEKIQSDIFDHLLTASKEFKLEISQTIM